MRFTPTPLFTISALLALAAAMSAHAQVYKTLPRGVRMLGYRNVQTTRISSEYNQSQAESPISYSLNATAPVLEEASETIRYFFQQLQATNPGAYNNFTYGEYQIDGEAQMQVHGMGLGYGITDRLTVYGMLPYYTANVRVKYKQNRPSNVAETSDKVATGATSDSAQLLANTLAAFPEGNGNLLQSVVVNVYGYQELGNWQGSGYGDMELGMSYNVVDRGYWGLTLTGGAVAPTGRVDDPDMLQDIAFGDGQWDGFAEAATGYSFTDHFRVGTTVRYTYQAPAEKTLRVPTSRDYTLSEQKGTFDVKFGDRVDASFLATAVFNDWFSLTPAYEVFYQAPSQYSSAFGAANDYLAYNSDRMGHNARMTASISSISPYMKKQFLLPAQLNFMVQQTVSGKNVPKVGRFEMELRVLF
jgi:hypothetical protein